MEHPVKTKVIGTTIQCGKCSGSIVVDWPDMASFGRMN